MRHDVGGLEIAVRDAVVVGQLHGTADDAQHFGRTRRTEAAAEVELVAQARTAQ